MTNYLIAIFLCCFSTSVMSYISMATPIGPWIAPTLVLCALIISKIIPQENQSKQIALATAAGSIGGIVATGFGFSFPTLYFLDPQLFGSWIGNIWYFAAIMAGLAFVAGGFGLLIANLIEYRLIVQQELSFPIGQLTYKMIAAGNQIKKAYQLAAGFVSTTVFCLAQDGIARIPGILPLAVNFIPRMQFAYLAVPPISFDLFPLLWAIGFITGYVIALPLLVGAISKVFLIDPTNTLFFSSLSNTEFVLAFCSGMVLQGAIVGFLSLPSVFKQFKSQMKSDTLKTYMNAYASPMSREIIFTLLGMAAFFFYFNFSFIVQSYLFLFTFVCAYQLAIIAGKIGLAPLGRFATFVMVPAMILFKLDYVQIVFIATFVEVAGGVTADALFSRKMGRLMNIDSKEIRAYQYGGLIVCSMIIGLVFWLLITSLQLGSPQLFAYKAYSRRLLIDVKQFNIFVLCIGALFGYILKFLKINPMLVLGGLLMPINISLGLIFGGALSLLTNQREAYEPFWSGVFAANSLWVLIKAIFY